MTSIDTVAHRGTVSDSFDKAKSHKIIRLYSGGDIVEGIVVPRRSRRRIVGRGWRRILVRTMDQERDQVQYFTDELDVPR
jgi:hypothetical protein